MGNVPSYNYQPLTVSTPAGTAIATPQTTSWGPFVGNLQTIELLVPSGHRGFTGLSIQASGMSLLPFGSPGVWIVADDYVKEFDVDIQWIYPLKVVTYNTDTIAHKHYLRAKVMVSGTTTTQAAPAPAIMTPSSA